MTHICLTNFEHGSNGVGAGNMGFTWLLPRIDCSFEGGHCARLAGQPVDSLNFNVVLDIFTRGHDQLRHQHIHILKYAMIEVLLNCIEVRVCP